MTTPIVEVKNLTRRFGNIKAVDKLNFSIEKGEVMGFIGANGAGKTTTMRMMATLEVPTQGSIEICGHNVLYEPKKVRELLGWMPDHFGTYSHLTVFEYLDFYARAFGYKGSEREDRVQEVMDFTDLATIQTRMMDKLSKGMGQRLCLGRTLLHDPEFLILDEPAAGLDPKARVEFKRLVGLLAEEGKTLFISSHILSELEEMCTSMLFIDQGKLIHQGSADSLKQKTAKGQNLWIETLDSPDNLFSWIENHPGVQLKEELKQGARVILESHSNEDLAATLRGMIQDGIQITEFRKEHHRLEDAFIDILDTTQENS